MHVALAIFLFLFVAGCQIVTLEMVVGDGELEKERNQGITVKEHTQKN